MIQLRMSQLGHFLSRCGCQTKAIPAVFLVCMAMSWNATGQDRQWCATNSIEDRFGKVTLSQPKVWRFDRVFSTLDGLLRDIDAVQLQALTNLDANSIQQFMADYLTASLDAKVKFDQANLSTNVLGKQLQAVQQMGNSASLEQQRQLATLSSELIQTIAHQGTLNQSDPAWQADQTKITNLNTTITALRAVSVPTGSSSASVNSTGFTDTSTPPSPTPVIRIDDLKALMGTSGSGVSLPPTKKLDAFITLLHERLSRELSAIFDDSSRGKSIYLLQFDVAVFPSRNASNRVLGIKYEIEDATPLQLEMKSPAEIKPSLKWLAYDLYPSASAYNVAQFAGVTRSVGIGGSIASLIGVGASVDYKRQKDHLQEGVLQSVYSSAFGSGQPIFGWILGSAPSEKLLSPGVHTMYALLEGPQEGDGQGPKAINIIPRIGWFPHDRLVPTKSSTCSSNISAVFDVKLPPPDEIKLARVAYRTRYLPVSSFHDPTSPTWGPPEKDFAYVELSTDGVIDPNLVITVNGQVLKRVRDIRGRATTATSPTQSQFGLLETDSDTDSSWFATGSKNITLKISRALATTTTFPTVRLIGSGDSGGAGTDLLSLLNKSCGWSLSINDVQINRACTKSGLPYSVIISGSTTATRSSTQSFIESTPLRKAVYLHSAAHDSKPGAEDRGNPKRTESIARPLAATTLIPLFSSVDSSGLSIVADEPDCPEQSSADCHVLRIQLRAGKSGPDTVAPMDENSQVLIKDVKGGTESIACHPYRSSLEQQVLNCPLPNDANQDDGAEVLLERPPTATLPGFSARTHLLKYKDSSDGQKYANIIIYPHSVKPHLNSAGETESWDVDVSLWKKEGLKDIRAGYAEALSGRVISNHYSAAVTVTVMPSDSDPDYQHAYFRIPRSCLSFVRTHQFEFQLGRERYPISDLFDWFMPSNLTVEPLPEIKSVVLRGRNLDSVQSVVLRGYKKPKCKQGCDQIPVTRTSSVLSFSVPADLAPGYYPILFNVGSSDTGTELYEPHLATSEGLGLQFNGTPRPVKTVAAKSKTGVKSPPTQVPNPSSSSGSSAAGKNDSGADPSRTSAQSSAPSSESSRPLFQINPYSLKVQGEQRQSKER